MTDSSTTASDVCYRHPNRQSFVLCQRCGRTICADCQTPAAVGFHCPECMKEARQSAPRTRPAVVTAFRANSSTPVVTYSIIALCVVIYIAQLLSNGAVTAALFYHPFLTETQPWRMITSLFLHSPQTYLHIIFNMFSLFVIGPPLELALGRWRYLALYLLSGLGGSVAVLLLAPTTGVLGASGAIFGLLGAFFIIQRRLGGRNMQIIVVIGINLVIGFVIPNIAWQAHVGGLVVGGLVAFVLLRTRPTRKRNEQLVLLFSVFVGLVVLTVIGVMLLHNRLL
ncbi:membrane associated rhomboid family serine protease [Cryobacterium mesophilum]|uniref:Rhomboid family intramembrane serine protease n=1 Tax=Terrimesophilobacter mesophilus TaxID=433647 RepID=A0A4R8V9Q2_9MICO|nr:rhomboid family intramembrane serine protease [Terrimesophilobacter mesophilus]MBB5633149.1 membrane associated rhomboid family serine protease [Terrimesophilobacter mesophilus]TFB79904.1 rhomboid family intramembrane serine protease [Terrimesophilobacter mesophilus]